MLEIDKIYQVDCLDGMSKIDDKSVSLILTDPPYEISRDSNYAKSAPTGKDTDRFRISIDFGDWDKQEAFDIGSKSSGALSLSHAKQSKSKDKPPDAFPTSAFSERNALEYIIGLGRCRCFIYCRICF